MDFVWEKPVITFYTERFGKPEKKAFAVVKARRLIISRKDDDAKLNGSIEDFFPLMGKIDQLSAEDGKADRYILCWFDDNEDDFGQAFRRIMAVTFPEGMKYKTNQKGKRTYNASFKAETGKLE